VATEYASQGSPGNPDLKFVQSYDDDNGNGIPDGLTADNMVGKNEPTASAVTNIDPFATGPVVGPSKTYLEGAPQTQHDYDGDGVPNGVEYMPDFLPLLTEAMGLTTNWRMRTYGIADIVHGEILPIDVHLLGFYVPGSGGVAMTIVGTPFAPPDPLYQTVSTCTPLDFTVHVQKQTTAPDFCVPCTPLGSVTYGDVVQEVSIAGSQSVSMLVSDIDDYDEDSRVPPEDLCNRGPGITNADADGDLTSDVCDPSAGSADNDGDGNGTATDRATDFLQLITNTASCRTSGNQICDNDVDGDRWINNVDNCETVANANQDDDDGDSVGDVCDKHPTSGLDRSQFKGSGVNTSNIDNDLVCTDAYATGATESFGDGPGPGGCGKTDDANDNGVPDGSDTSSDEDDDGFTDAQEANASSPTSPLNPAFNPATSCIQQEAGPPSDSDSDFLADWCDQLSVIGTLPAIADTDGDSVRDGVEVAVGTNPSLNTGSYLGTDDRDGDGCRDDRELGTNPTNGGMRHPGNYWDLYDVNGDQAVDLSDTLLILGHFGHGPSADAFDEFYDRGTPLLGRPLVAIDSTTGIDLTDALVNLSQFGHGCANDGINPGPQPPPGGGRYD
jgi:hypothetical protein